MAENWKPYNRREDNSSKVFAIASWVIGTLAALFVLATIAAQVYLKAQP